MEHTEVTHKHVGYTFSINIDKEERFNTGAKYPDRTTTTIKVGGNADTFEDCMNQLSKAKKEVLKILGEVTETNGK